MKVFFDVNLKYIFDGFDVDKFHYHQTMREKDVENILKYDSINDYDLWEILAVYLQTNKIDNNLVKILWLIKHNIQFTYCIEIYNEDFAHINVIKPMKMSFVKMGITITIQKSDDCMLYKMVWE